MYSVSDPSTTPVEREVPANPYDKAKGSLVLLMRGVPTVKWRQLSDDVERARVKANKISELYQVISAEKPGMDELEDWEKRMAATSALYGKAASQLDRAQKNMVAWGIIGHKDFTDFEGNAHPIHTKKEQWLNASWDVLDEKTLTLYEDVGLLRFLATYVAMYQNRTLPEALEGHFEDAKKE